MQSLEIVRRAKAAALRAGLDAQVEAKHEQAAWNLQEKELEDFSAVRVRQLRGVKSTLMNLERVFHA